MHFVLIYWKWVTGSLFVFFWEITTCYSQIFIYYYYNVSWFNPFMPVLPKITVFWEHICHFFENIWRRNINQNSSPKMYFVNLHLIIKIYPKVPYIQRTLFSMISGHKRVTGVVWHLICSVKQCHQIFLKKMILVLSIYCCYECRNCKYSHLLPSFGKTPH